MDSQTRLRATKYIWMAYAFSMLFLMINSAANNQDLGAGHVVIIAIMTIGGFLSTGNIWNWGSLQNSDSQSSESTLEKRKGNAKLERMLERLSDEERFALRHHLESEQAGRYALEEDGELVQYR